MDIYSHFPDNEYLSELSGKKLLSSEVFFHVMKLCLIDFVSLFIFNFMFVSFHLYFTYEPNQKITNFNSNWIINNSNHMNSNMRCCSQIMPTLRISLCFNNNNKYLNKSSNSFVKSSIYTVITINRISLALSNNNNRLDNSKTRLIC